MTRKTTTTHSLTPPQTPPTHTQTYTHAQRRTLHFQLKLALWSVLGPILFVLYTHPISEIVSYHSLSHHSFSDDRQPAVQIWQQYSIS